MIIRITIIIIFSIFTHTSYSSNQKIDWNIKKKSDFINQVKSIDVENLKIQAYSDTIEVQNKITIKFQGEHIIKRVQRIWFFPNTDSLNQNSTETIGYNEIDSSVVINSAGTIQNGTIEYVKPENTQQIDSDTYNSFTSFKELAVPYPSLTAGSLAFIDYETITHRHLQEMKWSTIIYPQNLFLRLNFEVTVIWNDQEKKSWGNNNPYIKCIEEKDILTCSGKNIKEAKNDHSILWRDELGQLVISEYETWKSINKSLTQVYRSSLIINDDIQKLYQALTANKDTIEEKISAIQQFVSQEVRYVSRSENGHAYTPHKTIDTLNQRYGDCKDKSILLVALLKLAGIEAYPVIVSTKRRSLDPLTVPALNYFDHVIACFEFKGKKYCIDSTDSNTNWLSFSSWIQGKVAFSPFEQTQPSPLPFNNIRWETHINSELKIDHKGGLEEQLRRTYKNEYAANIRQLIHGKNQDERNQWATEYYAQKVSKRVTPVFTYDGLENIEDDVIISSETLFPPFLSLDSDLHFIEYDNWLIEEIDGSYIKNKVYDTHFTGFKTISTYHINPSARWKINGHSPELDLRHEYGYMERKVTVNSDNTISYTTTILIPARIVSAEKATEFNQLLDIMRKEAVLRVYGKINGS